LNHGKSSRDVSGYELSDLREGIGQQAFSKPSDTSRRFTKGQQMAVAVAAGHSGFVSCGVLGESRRKMDQINRERLATADSCSIGTVSPFAFFVMPIKVLLRSFKKKRCGRETSSA